MQLPPFFESPVYMPLSLDTLQMHTGCLGNINLWKGLFSYDELLINVRQKDGLKFVSLLSRVCLGYANANDVRILNNCKLALDDNSVSDKMQQVVNAISSLPSDTVCLLPTHSTCNELNKEMLKSLPGEEIRLLAAD